MNLFSTNTFCLIHFLIRQVMISTFRSNSVYILLTLIKFKGFQRLKISSFVWIKTQHKSSKWRQRSTQFHFLPIFHHKSLCPFELYNDLSLSFHFHHFSTLGLFRGLVDEIYKLWSSDEIHFQKKKNPKNPPLYQNGFPLVFIH